MTKLSTQLIEAVHAVEAKYGRTSNAPDNCPELRACHQIVLKMAGSPEGDVHRQMIVIRRLMKRKLTHEAIALKVGLSLSTVNKRIRQIGAGEGHEIAEN
ncbi:hypothetical protein EFM54_11925 [Lentilactobacillus buchneri]|uniref:hypothetical protein n=1 Tax=Lentilactobacillus buchneri TaxID=1581 RepID=UPI0021A7D7C8|nr:hypothetical protein [Lentilactobacillus buchneri]MCT2899671.1 hypothetical protein [Lentilactobacillus buchneri]